MIAWKQAKMDGIRAAQAAPPSALTSVMLDDARSIADLLPEWRMLADRIESAGLFLQPSVWQSWHRTIGSNTTPQVICVRDHGQLVGVMPVMFRHAWRGPTLGVRYDYDPADRRWLRNPSRRWVPVRQISPVMSLPATMLGPALLAAPDRSIAVISAVAHQVVRLRGWDVAVIPVDANEAAVWQRAFGAVGARSAVQKLDRLDFSLKQVVPLEVLAQGQPQKFRANLRRARAAADKASLRTTVVTDLPLSQSHLAALANQSWKARGRDGQDVIVPYAGPQQAFFDMLCQADHAPQSVIATIMQGDAPVAITLGVRHGQTLTIMLTFWNEKEKKASAGLLCMGALVDWAAKEGMRRIDFNSNSLWLRFLTDTVTLNHNLLVFAPTWRGKLLAEMYRATTGLRDWLRRAGMGRRRECRDDDGA